MIKNVFFKSIFIIIICLAIFSIAKIANAKTCQEKYPDDGYCAESTCESGGQADFGTSLCTGGLACCHEYSASNFSLEIPIFGRTEFEGLADYISFIFQMALIIIIPLATLVMIYAGVLWIFAAGNSTNIDKAKQYILGALAGVIIALLSYYILSIVNLNVLKEPRISLVKEQKDFETPLFPDVASVYPSYSLIDLPGCESGYCTHAEAAALLAEHGISISSTGGCFDPNVPTCTSLTNMPKKVIQRLIQIKDDIEKFDKTKCDFKITGGTETGHKTHGQYQPFVDISQEPCLVNALRDRNKDYYGIKQICTTAKYNDLSYNCGNYVEKTPHFHLKF